MPIDSCIIAKNKHDEIRSRFVPDYEVAILAEYFHISTDELLGKGETGQ